MTDSEGKHHLFTMPAGKVSPSIWAHQQAHAKATLPPQFSELVQRTKVPFIQCITDVVSPRHVFMDGKVLLVGDALAGFRPHTAASTSQAAMNALALDEYMGGKIGLKEWKKKTGDWGKWMAGRGREMGNRSQFGHHPMADDS